jgi:hypothetical protein
VTDVTRSYCPLDCGWYHDSPNGLDFTKPIPTGPDAALLILTDRVQRAEQAIRDHLEGHGLLEWVQAVTRLKQDAAKIDAVLRDNGFEYPLGHRGVLDMAAQRQGYLDELEQRRSEEPLRTPATPSRTMPDKAATSSDAADIALPPDRNTGCER